MRLITVREDLPIYSFRIGDKVIVRPIEEQRKLDMSVGSILIKQIGKILIVTDVGAYMSNVCKGHFIDVRDMKTGKTVLTSIFTSRFLPVGCGTREVVE